MAFAPATLSLLAGQSGSVTVSVGLLGSYTGTVSLSCIPPVNSSITCAFSPSSLTGSGASTLTVTTVAGKAKSAGFSSQSKLEGIAAVSLAALLCLTLPGRARRRMIPTMLLVLLALTISANLGCGGNGFYSTTPVSGAGNGTPLGTSILTINTAGTDGVTTIHHDYSFQVTVQ